MCAAPSPGLATVRAMSTRTGWLIVGSFTLLAGLGPCLATLRAVPPLTGFGLFVLGGMGCLLSGIGLPIAVAVQRKRGLLGPAALAWLVAAPLLFSGTQGRDAPAINDISTDLEQPPAITVEGRPILAKHDLNYPEEWKEIVREGYPDLEGRALAASREDSFVVVEAAARTQEGWTLHRVDAASGIIEGSEETRLFHLVDDFTIRVVGEQEGARVHMRSRSRDGRGDLGVNAARIRAFLGGLKL